MRIVQVFFATAVAIGLFSAVVSAQNAGGYVELPRFQQVSDRLYRGGQPRAGGLQRLRELGFDTIVNLRGASKRTRAEEAEARALGLNYFSVPLPNWGRPQDERVRRILLIMAAPQNGRVFVHCKDGVDRTGTIVALHRITREGWTTSDALAEAERLGMRRIQFWMRDYADDYDHAHAVQYLRPDSNLGDRLGAGIRIVEGEAFRARKVGGRVLRRAPGLISKFLGDVF
jgi:protein tyrosine phosphatase (PTP) superfamily phosphohydrolase (DUF442 family)